MKRWSSRIVVTLLVVAMTGVMALAKSKKQTVTFPSNVKVNGTLIKQGTYDLKFDEQTNELSVLKNGKTIAKTPARVEKRDGKSKGLEIRTMGSGDDTQLIAVAFDGSSEKFVVNESGGQTGNN